MAHHVANKLSILRNSAFLFFCVLGLSACTAGAMIAAEVFATAAGTLVTKAIVDDGTASKPPVALYIHIYDVWLTEELVGNENTPNKISTISTIVRLTDYAEREGHNGVIELWKTAETGDLKIAEHVYYIPKGKTDNTQDFVVKCLANDQPGDSSSSAETGHEGAPATSEFYVYEREQKLKSKSKSADCIPAVHFENSIQHE